MAAFRRVPDTRCLLTKAILTAISEITRMAQLWLTDQELGEELGCAASAARTTAISNGWARKKSQDGFSRTLLPQTMMIAFIFKAAQQFVDSGVGADRMVAMLRSIPDKSVPALPPSKIAS
jgi:hypothetical protein